MLSKKLLRPAVARKAVGLLRSELDFSERRGCCVLGVSRTSNRYQSKRGDRAELLADLPAGDGATAASATGGRTSCCAARAGGEPQAGALRENDWLVRRRQRKRLASLSRLDPVSPTRPNRSWA